MKKFFCFLVLMCFSLPLWAQLQLPQPSPSATLTQTVGLTDVTVEYSRPAKRGRTVFGELVPFGEVWRTGANASTKITFSDPVTFSGQQLPAGQYALYTIPQEGNWTVIFHKNLEHWGSDGYAEADDALRVTAPVQKTALPVESFTIGINNVDNEQATLDIAWDDRMVSVPFTVDAHTKAQANIQQALATAGDNWQPYAQAANYYLQNDLDAAQAMAWLDKSVSLTKHFWNLHLQSVAYAKRGDYQQALATAEQALPLAQEANNPFYIGQIQSNIADWQTKVPAKGKSKKKRS
ncbi:DUF2911 domain-containing protein [Catalinimonas alkaloidigena]|nr:DUF2911 domain-containing protein [Catalinimonas alkaloidigena]